MTSVKEATDITNDIRDRTGCRLLLQQATILFVLNARFYCIAELSSQKRRINHAKSRPAKNNRKFINTVIWILRTGAPWRDLPLEYGDWNNMHLEIVKQDSDFEWLMIDAYYVKVHPHAAGAAGGNQDMGRTKGGSTQK